MDIRTVLATVAVSVGFAAMASPAATAQQPVDVSKLPVDVSRIQRGLQQQSEREERDGLSLRYMIEVYGQSPRLVLFTKEDNLANGPVPYGAPTHNEILNIITPPEYRAPVADFGSLIRWLADKSKKSKADTPK